MRYIILTMAVLLYASRLSAAQIPDPNTEALVNCPGLFHPEPLTPYGFAKADLVSLWYARNADRSNEIVQAAKESDNGFAYLTALMRITKNSTNDFICAKRSVAPFMTKQAGENVSTAATFLADVYDSHIRLNQQTLDLLKNLDSTSMASLSDQLSTLQVERGQRWADLVRPTSMALMLLIDVNHADENGKVTRLIVNKEEKQALLAWADEHFPEFKNGTPKDHWSDPAKTAEMYFMFFSLRKCADE